MRCSIVSAVCSAVRASPCSSCPISRTAPRCPRSPAYAAKLRGWAEAGVEMFLHGWCHRDDARKRGFMQKHMTAGARRIRAASQGRSAAPPLRRTQGGGRRHRAKRRGLHRPGLALFAGRAGGARRSRLRARREPPQGLAADHRPRCRQEPRHHLGESHARPCAQFAHGRRRRARRALGIGQCPHRRPPRATPLCLPLLDSIDATYRAFMRTHRPARYADLLA